MILVTGASGFIGKHLMSSLVDEYGVDNVIALTSNPIKEYRCLLHKNYTFNKEYISASGFDKITTIIHAGAFIPKTSNEIHNIKDCNANIFTTERLLLSNLPNLKKIIFISTVDVYKDSELIDENTSTVPASLYGYSKLYCEKIIKQWAKKQNVTYQVLRLGHVYGPGEDKYQKVIPVVMKRLLENLSLNIYGEGDEVRTFIYVKDVVKIILAAIKHNANIEAVNVVGNVQITIKELITLICKVTQKSPTIQKTAKNQSKFRKLIFNNTMVSSLFNVSFTPIEEGLKQEWEYMKKIEI